mmetsp:Transcript_22360/g.16844  ORF Transcript_22360/g.16844 Transcript_22360/m.16844 type:complete len:129 (+) Transcript_22360:479-865(+)
MSKVLIASTGWTTENIPKYLEGVEGYETYGSHPINKERYKNRNVLILGKGNSAFETAEYLTDTAANIFVNSRSPITHSWWSRYVGHLRSINNTFLDTYLLKLGNAVDTLTVREVRKVGDQFQVFMDQP